MRVHRCRILLTVFFLSGLRVGVTAPARPQVDVITIKSDMVSAVLERYIHLGITGATSSGAECLVIELHTPGGLVSTMEDITTEILNADVPVVVYVAPRGAGAVSAGVFIAYASHVLAMAPATRIGAAHPVLMGFSGPPDNDEEEKSKSGKEGRRHFNSSEAALMEKITNDLSARIRTIAEERGRNPDWGEDAVRKAVSISEKEAVRLKVAELIATDLADLLRKIDGRKVKLPSRTVTLHTAHAVVNRRPMNLVQQWLSRMMRPEVMMILGLLTLYGLIGEITHPGSLLPGIVGVVSFIMMLLGASVIPVNWAGFALVAVGMAMMLAEVKFPTAGALLLGGLIAFVLGALVLFDTPGSTQRLSFTFILPLAALTAAFFTFVVAKGLRAQSLKRASGAESMVGLLGTARSSLNPEGQVQVRGEWWRARASDRPIESGTRVEVVAIDGHSLIVRPRPG